MAGAQGSGSSRASGKARPIARTSDSAAFSVAIVYSYRAQLRAQRYLLYGFGGLFLMGLGIRAMVLHPV